MKIVCNHCSTKYSIADDKVAGGVFQTPCKRCGSVMTIRGAGAAQEPAASEGGLLGERRENSLLFSLNDLASMGDAPAGSARSNTPPREGSGLLDIRSMAGAYFNAGNSQAGAERESFLDIAASPSVIVPVVAPREQGKRPLLWLVGGATGMAAIATIAIALVLFKTSPASDAQASTNDPQVASLTPVAVEPPPVPDATTPLPVEPVAEPVDEPEPEPEPAVEKPEPDTPTARRPRRPREPKVPVEVVEKPKDPPKKGCLEEVGCLLASNPPPCCRKYLDPKPDPKEPEDRVDSSLPKELERGDIKDSMNKISGRISACSSRSTVGGTVTVSVKVGGNGKVSSARIKSSPDADLGACVADAARKARFPKTQDGGSFSYPFVFR